MVCRKEAQTGSSFAVRVCQPRYVLAAKETSAAERMRAATSAGEASGAANSRGPDVGNAIAGVGAADLGPRQEAMRKNLLEVLQSSPELQELGRKRDELQARYDAAAKGN